MSTLTNLSFVAKVIKGGLLSAGATQISPTGIVGNVFYLVTDGLTANVKSSICTGRIIGFIAYDIVASRWAYIQTAEYVLTSPTNQQAGGPYTNDVGAIKDFIANLKTPDSLTPSQNGDLPMPGNQAMCLPIGS